jgi:hypothetical protein
VYKGGGQTPTSKYHPSKVMHVNRFERAQAAMALGKESVFLHSTGNLKRVIGTLAWRSKIILDHHHEMLDAHGHGAKRLQRDPPLFVTALLERARRVA